MDNDRTSVYINIILNFDQVQNLGKTIYYILFEFYFILVANKNRPFLSEFKIILIYRFELLIKNSLYFTLPLLKL